MTSYTRLLSVATRAEADLKMYHDASHAWLAVKRRELDRLGILGTISSYSFQRGKTVYLEEDADAMTFLRAHAKANPNSQPIKVYNSHCERSPIRSYDRFEG